MENYDVISWIIDDITRNANISVNINRFLPPQKTKQKKKQKKKKTYTLVLVVALQLFGENRIQLNGQNDWQKLRK